MFVNFYTQKIGFYEKKIKFGLKKIFKINNKFIGILMNGMKNKLNRN